MSNKIRPEDVPLTECYKDNYLFEWVRGIKVRADTRTLFRMCKEYESKKRGITLYHDDFTLILLTMYQEVHQLDFWHPQHPQYRRIPREDILEKRDQPITIASDV